MSANTAEEIYELVQKLPTVERLRLVERIAHDLSAESTPAEQAGQPFDWTRLAGAAPGLLLGEDAQAWVTTSRHGADEARERIMVRKP